MNSSLYCWGWSRSPLLLHCPGTQTTCSAAKMATSSPPVAGIGLEERCCTARLPGMLRSAECTYQAIHCLSIRHFWIPTSFRSHSIYLRATHTGLGHSQVFPTKADIVQLISAVENMFKQEINALKEDIMQLGYGVDS